MSELNQINSQLQDLKTQWIEILENLTRAKEEIKNEDLFATIDFLAFCDQMSQTIFLNLQEIDTHLQKLTMLRKKGEATEKNSALFKNLFADMEELKNSMQNQMKNVDEMYPLLSEKTLRHSQDIIANFSERMEREPISPNLKTEIYQNLDKELFLQELKDTLEAYRQARESYISELQMDSIRKLPEDHIPEDLGEEDPEIDSILTQLDSAINACDRALIIKEITD
jgi:hypothetical protein